MHVRFDDDVERGNFASLNLGEDVFQLDTTLHTSITALIERAITLFAGFGHSLCSLFVWCRAEFIASVWHCA